MTTNKPASLKPTKIQTIRPMYLVALYSVGAVILLSYLSFKWVYSHPSQVAIRIEKAAQEAGVFSVKVLGATQESLAGMRADELAIDAGEASLASLTGVHVGDVEVHCGGRAKGTSRVGVEAGGIRGGTPVLACSAKVDLEGGGEGWNVSRAFDSDQLRAAAEAAPFEILVRELDLGLSLGEGWGRRVQLGDLELSGGLDGLRGRAIISKSADWDGGSISIKSAGPGEWVAQGFLQNIRSGKDWRPLLPSSWATLWDRLSPEGDLSLRIDRLTGGSGEDGFSGSLQGSSLALRLPVVGLAVTGLNGSAKLGDGSISWGKGAGLDQPGLVLLGQSGALSGTLDSKEGSLQVAFSEQELTGEVSAGAPQAINELVGALRPAGRLSGVLDVNIASMAKDAGDWKLLLSLDALKLLGASFIDPGKVLLQLEGKKDGAAAGGFSGSLAVADLTIQGLVSLGGTIGLTWSEAGLALEAEELAIRVAGASEAESRGLLKGSLRTLSDGGGIEGDVDWTGVELASSLLAAEEMSGHVSIELATGVVLGESRLKRIRLPAGLLGQKELAYETGVAEWSVDADGVKLSVLELSGSQGAVRITGKIGFDARVDLVSVRVGVEEAAALTALPLKTGPADWVAASNGAYGASRISGKMDNPLVQPVYRDDRILTREVRNESADQ